MSASPKIIDEVVADGFVILSMTQQDLAEVVDLETAAGLSRWGFDGYTAELRRTEAVLLVARSHADASLLGFVAARLTLDELHINNVAVRAEHRRCGLGRALLSEALARGSLRGAKWTVLEVRAGNHAARSAYDRLGFEIVGRRPDYYSAPIEDALVMGRNL